MREQINLPHQLLLKIRVQVMHQIHPLIQDVPIQVVAALLLNLVVKSKKLLQKSPEDFSGLLH